MNRTKVTTAANSIIRRKAANMGHQQQNALKEKHRDSTKWYNKILHSQDEQIQIRIYPQNFTWTFFRILSPQATE